MSNLFESFETIDAEVHGRRSATTWDYEELPDRFLAIVEEVRERSVARNVILVSLSHVTPWADDEDSLRVHSPIFKAKVLGMLSPSVGNIFVVEKIDGHLVIR
jgi:hypothetical protein